MNDSRPETAQKRGPAVSVVIPAYNAATFITKTLETVHGQTNWDWELIVVDDGSRDGTAAVVTAFMEREGIQGRCITQPNRGIAGARNTGIREATGDYVAFLDHDDIWHPAKLDRALAVLESDPSIGVVCHDEHVVSRGTVVATNRQGPYAEDVQADLLLKGNSLSPSATVVRRALLDQVGGFREGREFHTVEDYDLWIRLSRLTRFQRLREVLGEYVQRDTSAIRDVDAHYRNMIDMVGGHIRERFGPASPWPVRWRIRRMLGRLHCSAALAVMKSGRNPSARWRHLRTALREWPFAPSWLLTALLSLVFPIVNLAPAFGRLAERCRQARYHLAGMGVVWRRDASRTGPSPDDGR